MPVRYRRTENKKYQALREEIFDRQNGLCGICGNTGSPKTLWLDHSHRTNEIRGLLCRNCNADIGFLQDNIETLYAAVDYLLKEDCNYGELY